MAKINLENCALGIELGSTRIKAVLIGENAEVVASGSYAWENKLADGIWTYSEDDIWTGIRACYAAMKKDAAKKYGAVVKKLRAIGFSGMMHGYIVLDSSDKLLTPFRTWRNTITGLASERLTELFDFHVPERWSIAHLYQAMLNNESHVKDIAFMTTLSGYVHYNLTGEKCLGIGEASGVFPISGNDYNSDMMQKFDALNGGFKLKDILPRVLLAGENAGYLTEKGAKMLDESGDLQAGIPLCPPEGDAGTGMVATNSVAPLTGNVSAGTSVFAMIVLDKPLSKLHKEIDMVTTPTGSPVAMVHCNNCTSDINAWANLFGNVLKAMGVDANMDMLYTAMFESALRGNSKGMLAYNYLSGEHITGFSEGRPLFVRSADSALTLPNFMKTHLFSSLATLKIGMDILKGEGITIKKMLGHGGFFKTKDVGQLFMSAAMSSPVSVMETAGEGGAWGMAILAGFMADNLGMELSEYLAEKVFNGLSSHTVSCGSELKQEFENFIASYKKGFEIEKNALLNL